ncbi:MAG: hypothetical protein Q4F05_03620 [bacterium]|nr:hypothetical protein [bacterium]
MSILTAIGAFIGETALSGLTWDAIKNIPNVVDSFTLKFKNYFKTKENAMKALEILASQPCLNENDPISYAAGISTGLPGALITEQNKTEFTEQIKEWIKDRIKNESCNTNIQVISGLEVKDYAIVNIGINQNNTNTGR